MLENKRIIFAGTPEFAAVHLQALLDNNIRPVAVYTQPDRPSGRGNKLTPTPVKQLALEHGLEVYTPENFKDEADVAAFQAHNADLAIVVAYGLLLPQSVLDAPVHGCVNVHGSLLPSLRGAAPIQRSLLNGDEYAGVSLMRIVKALDAGPVFVKKQLKIQSDDTSLSLFEKLAHLGAATLIENLDKLCDGLIEPLSQDENLVTYAAKLTKAEAHIDFNDTASQIDLKVRGFIPWPVAYTKLADIVFKLFEVQISDIRSQGAPGTIHAVDKSGILVNTQDFCIRIITLQAPGKSRTNAADYARGKSDLIKVGARFE